MKNETEKIMVTPYLAGTMCMHKDGACGEEGSNIVIEGTEKQKLRLEAKKHARDCSQYTMMQGRSKLEKSGQAFKRPYTLN